jgi:hypothetical protein
LSDESSSTEEVFETDAEAILFGFPPASLRVRLHRRSRSWRVWGAARIFGTSLLVTPVMALLPPHAIWPVGVLLTGAFLARRRLSEHFTLLELVGMCPKCDAQLHIRGGRLREAHTLPCDGCHHQSTLKVAAGLLESRAE